MLRSVIVLRHAHAGRKADWTGADAHRPLSLEGLHQTAGLVAALEDHRFDQIWTSPFARCHHTIAPLAANRRTPVIAAPWLAPDTDQASIEHGLSTLVGRVLLCTHGECVEPILHALMGGRESMSGIDKGHALALSFGPGGEVDDIHHIAPSEHLR